MRLVSLGKQRDRTPRSGGRAPPQAVRISLLAVSVEFASKYSGGISCKTKRYVAGVQDVKADAGLHHEGRWSVGTHYQGVQMHEIQYDRSVKCCTANACNSAWAEAEILYCERMQNGACNVMRFAKKFIRKGTIFTHASACVFEKIHLEKSKFLYCKRMQIL